MGSLNKAMLIGNLGADPEIRHTNSGQAVCNFNIATTEQWGGRDGQEKQEKTEWHRIVLWGRLAEVANEYLRKGRQVYIEGRIQTRSWEDQQGQKKYTTEIVAQQMTMLGSRGGDGDFAGGGGGARQTSQSSRPSPAQTVASPPADAPAEASPSGDYFGSDDDLPF